MFDKLKTFESFNMFFQFAPATPATGVENGEFSRFFINIILENKFWVKCYTDTDRIIFNGRRNVSCVRLMLIDINKANE